MNSEMAIDIEIGPPVQDGREKPDPSTFAGFIQAFVENFKSAIQFFTGRVKNNLLKLLGKGQEFELLKELVKRTDRELVLSFEDLQAVRIGELQKQIFPHEERKLGPLKEERARKSGRSMTGLIPLPHCNHFPITIPTT